MCWVCTRVYHRGVPTRVYKGGIYTTGVPTMVYWEAYNQGYTPREAREGQKQGE